MTEAVFSDSPGQGIGSKIEGSSETGWGKESLVYTFSFIGLLLPESNFWRGDWALGNVSTQV